ncbi:beta-aryl ether-cleaving protein [Aureimonas sp. Leaf454]|uniref:glutathione S-transferase family protein n=1 Tax=Aureimonas sp. Leaf454 TaxID=1736381 RepID=UPI0006FC3F04|nr:glutathione S-transferase family protein [Aureimonas sp. Leaf454]KQT50788.1 beta-aryl ether-cleaving protein [Aureimonas sp. Leaf454]
MILYELVGADPSRPFSPHCWKARMALRHKGFEIETRPVPFTQVPLVENGFSKIVPVLRDGGTLVADSFAIAEHLEDAYPDRPTLFAGEGGRRLSRFVESWCQTALHPFIVSTAVLDLHDGLDGTDQAYFRQSREARLGTTLEAVPVGREARLPAFHAETLKPLNFLLGRSPFLGGESPLFADYIVFGAFQWARISSPFAILPASAAVADWFERCLDLHGGDGRSVPAAA